MRKALAIFVCCFVVFGHDRELDWADITRAFVSLNQSNVFQVESLHSNVFFVHNFLSPEECAQIRELHQTIAKRISPARWCLPAAKIQQMRSSGEISAQDLESSTCVQAQAHRAIKALRKLYNVSLSTVLPRNFHPQIDSLEDRLQELLGLPKLHAFHAQTVRYDAGAEYSTHTDCWLEKALPNDRAVTALVYLTEANESDGGETAFPSLGLRVRPRLGSALVWANVDERGRCLQSMRHASSPVEGKEPKLIFQKWYHRFPLCAGLIQEQTVCDDDSVSCRRYLSPVAQLTTSFESSRQALHKGDIKKALLGLERASSVLSPAAALRGELLLALAKDGLASLGEARAALEHAVRLCEADSESKGRLLDEAIAQIPVDAATAVDSAAGSAAATCEG